MSQTIAVRMEWVKENTTSPLPSESPYLHYRPLAPALSIIDHERGKNLICVANVQSKSRVTFAVTRLRILNFRKKIRLFPL